MAMLDLVRMLQEFKEKGWNLEDVIFLLEDEYIEVEEAEIDKVKCEVIGFVNSLTTDSGYGYKYLRYIITILIKENKSYEEALEKTAMKFWTEPLYMRKEMRTTIREMVFDCDQTHFNGINFDEQNNNLDKEFVEEAVELIKFWIG